MKTLTREELEKNVFIPVYGIHGSSWLKWICHNADGDSMSLTATRKDTEAYEIGISVYVDEKEYFFPINRLVDVLNAINQEGNKMENETKYPAEVQVEIHKLEHKKDSIVDVNYLDCGVFESWKIFSVSQYGLSIDVTDIFHYKDTDEWKYVYASMLADIAKKCLDKAGELHDTRIS